MSGAGRLRLPSPPAPGPTRPPPPSPVNKPAGIRCAPHPTPRGSAAVWRGAGGWASASPLAGWSGRAGVWLGACVSGAAGPSAVCLRVGGFCVIGRLFARPGLALEGLRTPGPPCSRQRGAESRTPGAPGRRGPSFPGSQTVSSSSFTAGPGDGPCNYVGPGRHGWAGADRLGRSLGRGRAGVGPHPRGACCARRVRPRRR